MNISALMYAAHLAVKNVRMLAADNSVLRPVLPVRNHALGG